MLNELNLYRKPTFYYLGIFFRNHHLVFTLFYSIYPQEKMALKKIDKVAADKKDELRK
jgi:hypothetical protein